MAKHMKNIIDVTSAIEIHLRMLYPQSYGRHFVIIYERQDLRQNSLVPRVLVKHLSDFLRFIETKTKSSTENKMYKSR